MIHGTELSVLIHFQFMGRMGYLVCFLEGSPGIEMVATFFISIIARINIQ